MKTNPIQTRWGASMYQRFALSMLLILHTRDYGYVNLPHFRAPQYKAIIMLNGIYVYKPPNQSVNHLLYYLLQQKHMILHLMQLRSPSTSRTFTPKGHKVFICKIRRLIEYFIKSLEVGEDLTSATGSFVISKHNGCLNHKIELDCKWPIVYKPPLNVNNPIK